MTPKERHLSSARSLGEERAARRKWEFQLAKDRFQASAMRAGTSAVGRDAEGNAAATRTLDSLPVTIDKWYVQVKFKRESTARLPQDWHGVEAHVKAGDVPRKAKTVTTHIITAVRLLKHIGEGYKDEIEATASALQALDLLNVVLADPKQRHTDDEIRGALAQLKEFDATDIAKKHVVVKKIVAHARLQEAIDSLEKLLKQPENRRNFALGAPCSRLSAFRERLGTWRDREIAGLAEYNREKESALRVERDNWLLSQLEMFAANPALVWERQQFDNLKLTVLEEITRMLRERKLQETVLAYVRAMSPLFRVSERERLGAEKRIEAIEATGIVPKDGKKVDYLIGHYGWLYKHVKSGDTQRALAKVAYLSTFVSANKPGFILRELSEDADPYLGKVLLHLGNAIPHYRMFQVDAAQKEFAAARDELKRIVAPEKA